MIISHKYKFIFIKTWETGGANFEIFMRPYLGIKDSITQIEVLNKHDREHNMQCSNIDISEHVTSYQLKKSAIHHNLISEEQWNTYYKFAFIRNPWELMVSKYYLMASCPEKYSSWNIRSMPPFNIWVKKHINLCPQWNSIRKNQYLYGAAGVDEVFKYEELYESITTILTKFKIASSYNRPARVGLRTKNISDIYSEKSIKKIEKMCSRIIKIGDYTYPKKRKVNKCKVNKYIEMIT